MSGVRICAALNCTNIIPERVGRGRPFSYCSAQCRPTPSRATKEPLVVVVDHQPTKSNERPVGRVWSVQLRRGTRVVIIAADLGRPSAEHLAADIGCLLNDQPITQGATID